MSRNASDPSAQALEEASTWFVAFRAREADEASRRDFHDWLKRSPDHVRAYLEIASTYAEIPTPEGGRTPLDLIEKARANSDLNVVPLAPGKAADRPPWMLRASGPDSRIANRQRRLPARLAAAVVALVVAAGTGWLYAQRNTYGTTVGEQRSITLADGSIVNLDACSKVRIEFSARERHIELLAGQALFLVAKDAARPFIVSTRNAKVRAVGTQFDVDRMDAGTRVTVIEGRVSVLPDANERGSRAHGAHDTQQLPSPAGTSGGSWAAAPRTASDEVLLAAGEQVTITRLHVLRVDEPNIAAATAWTQHRLVFDGTPLEEVVEEFNRYSTHRVVIDSPGLARLRISGQYTSTDPASLIRFLSLQHGVAVNDRDGQIHILEE
jgi:transmembrane sensor